MDFEFPSSGVHQDLVNVLDMALKVIDRCSSAVVDRHFHVVLDRFFCVFFRLTLSYLTRARVGGCGCRVAKSEWL